METQRTFFSFFFFFFFFFLFCFEDTKINSFYIQINCSPKLKKIVDENESEDEGLGNRAEW